MSKKMMKRSLVLGALMAFVITGSAMAAEVTNTINAKDITSVDSLGVNVVSGIGISAKGDEGNADVELNGDLNVNSSEEGVYAQVLKDNVAVDLDIKADKVNITSKNSYGIYIASGAEAACKDSTFTFESVGDMNIDGNGTAIFVDDGAYKTTTNIVVGDALTVDGTIRIKNGKSFDIIANSIKVDATDSLFGINSSNATASIIANGDIEVIAKNQGIYATCDNPAYSSGLRVVADNLKVDAVNALRTQVKGQLVVEVSKDATLSGNVLSEESCAINVDAGNDVIVDGNVLAQKGQIFVEADNDVTVNGNVESRSGEGSGHLPYVGIKAGENVAVNGSLVAHWAEGNQDEARPEGLKLEGKNITVDADDANVLYNGAGKTSFVAEESLVLNGKNGLVNEGGNVNVTADNINITAEDYAVISYSGTTEIAPSVSSNIVGDIFVDDLYGNATPVVNVDLGENGSLTGAVVNEHTGTNSGVNLDLGTGSTWTVTGNSNVTSLEGTDNNIKFDVNKEGSIATLAIADNSATGTQVTGTGAVSDYLAANGNDAEKAFADGVKDLDADGVLTTEEGMTGGAYTFTQNEKGEWVAAQEVNTKSDAVSDAGVVLKGHWRAHMNDMNKRMGELRNANGEHGVWTRMVRGESEYQGAKMQYNQYQMGYDEKLSVDKRWTVGAAVTFSEGDASYGSGSTDDKSTAFAIYGSKLNNDGTFVDLIARYARLESDLDDSNYGTGNYDANGYSVSAEFGKRIQQGNGLWIEPQAELTYGSVDGAQVNFSKGFTADYGSMDSFIARVGFAMGKDIKQGNVYARASYLYDFDGETETQFVGGNPISEDFGGGWWEVGVGANINLSKATYIYADVEKTFGGEVDTNWQWNLGVRYSF